MRQPVKRIIVGRLNEEVNRSGLTHAQFVSELDKAAAEQTGKAYQFGAVIAEFCALYNKETVCRIVRQWKQKHRIQE